MLRRKLLAGAQDAAAGLVKPGLYLAGWFRRGPRGTIPDNRRDAQELAVRIMADVKGAASRERAGRSIFDYRRASLTDYAGWQRIDQAEIEGRPEGRIRSKLLLLKDMLEIANEKLRSAP